MLLLLTILLMEGKCPAWLEHALLEQQPGVSAGSSWAGREGS